MDYEVIGKDRIDIATPALVSVDRIDDEWIVEWGGVKRPPKLSFVLESGELISIEKSDANFDSRTYRIQ